MHCTGGLAGRELSKVPSLEGSLQPLSLRLGRPSISHSRFPRLLLPPGTFPSSLSVILDCDQRHSRRQARLLLCSVPSARLLLLQLASSIQRRAKDELGRSDGVESIARQRRRKYEVGFKVLDSPSEPGLDCIGQIRTCRTGNEYVLNRSYAPGT
jgi:hypothetical protein